MTTRITQRDLQAVCDRINRTCGTPLTPYSRLVDGSFTPNANAYLIDYAYGGASLHQMTSDSGGTGESDVLGCGHVTKRDLYHRMRAFLCGIDAARGV